MASTLRSLLRRPPSSSSSKLHPLALPPAFLLPRFARLSTTVNTTNPEPLPAAFKPAQRPPNASKLQQAPRSQRPQALSPSPLEASNTPSQPQSVSDSPISETAAAAEPHHQSPPFPPPAQLHLLATQPPHYINVLIHGKHYLLTEGDVLRLPFKMPDATVGSVLRLTRASMLGSRDYTYRGDPVIDERHFICRARVIAIVTEPMRVKEKTKQRQRRVKTVKSKMRYTVLRITELRVMADGSEGDGS